MTNLEINNNQFCKIDLQTARQWYELGWIKTTAYLLVIYDLKKDPTWNWSINNVKEFCHFFGIDRSSFYRAMVSLEKKGYVIEESKQQYTVGKHRLFNSEIIADATVSRQCSSVSSKQQCRTNAAVSHPNDKNLTSETEISSLRQDSHQCENESSKPFNGKGSGVLPDISQNLSKLSSSRGEEINFSEEIKNSSHKSTVIDQPQQDSAITVESSVIDKFFGNSLKEEKHEFLTYAGDDTPWLNPPRRRSDINFKREFMEWHGQRWMQKFEKRDIYEAIADFRASLLNNPDKIPGRWEEYENHILHHAGNIQVRLENGCQITEAEQQKMITHLPSLGQFTSQEELLAIAPGTENAAAYKPFVPSPDISEEERKANLRRLSQMFRNGGKVVDEEF